MSVSPVAGARTPFMLQNTTQTGSEDFAGMLAQMNAVSSAPAKSTPSPSAPASPVKTRQAASAEAKQEFLAYMQKTPAQRMREAWLKSHNLTEEQLDAMPPEQRQAIEKQMADEIKEKLKQQAQNQQKSPIPLF